MKRHLAALVVLLAACSSTSPPARLTAEAPGTSGTPAAPGSTTAIVAEDEAAGGAGVADVGGTKVLWISNPNAAATPSWSTIAVQEGRRVHIIDGTNGQLKQTIEVGEGMSSPILSTIGTRLLVSDAGKIGSNGMPSGRTTVRAELYALGSTAPPVKFSIPANVVPEAVRNDGSSIAVLDFVPAQKPESYVVKDYAIGSRQLSVGYGRDKTTNTEMQGIAQRAVGDARYGLLHTLYSVPGTEGYAFVHALSPNDGWNFCIDLPADARLGNAKPAIAAGPDGWLYVVGTNGALVEIDGSPQSLRATKTVSLAGLGSEPPLIAASSDAIVVASGKKGYIVERRTLTLRKAFDLRETPHAVAVGRGGIYVSRAGAVDLYDAATGERSATGAVPAKAVLRLNPLA